MSDTVHVVCVPWGQQYIPSVKVQCSKCNADLAMDAKNVELIKREGATPLCIPCLHKGVDSGVEIEVGGGFIGGKKIEDVGEAIEASLLQRQLHEGRN